jgi:hypothetical protein
MANVFVTVLDAIGTAFKDFFKIALPVATAAEPVLAVAFPGVSTLYNMTVTLVTAAETAAAAAGAQSGTGPQKLALVLASLQPYATQEAAALGIAPPTVAQTTAYINSVVAGLNSFAAAAAGIPAAALPPTTQTIAGSTMTTEVTQ